LPRPRCEAFLEELRGALNDLEFVFGKIRELGRYGVDALQARTLQEPASRACRLHEHGAPIGAVRSPSDEPIAHESVDDPGHRR
jgi:hypothetical protein